jgi:hypothetical protein
MITRRRHAAAVVAVGVAALVSAAVLYGHRGYHTPTSAGAVPSATIVKPAILDPPQHDSATRGGRGAPPTRVVIASINVDAPVVIVGVHDGAVDVPDDPQQLGWWSDGARAGATTGSVVVVGHVDSWSAGRGALFHLESVPIGARATVETPRGPVHYRIVGRRVYQKQTLPSSVFARHGAPRLVLITCGGPFDRTTRHYADNVVVYGVPTTA